MIILAMWIGSWKCLFSLGDDKYKIPAVFRIRIQIHRIHVFLGLPDPDPLIRGMDPDPDLALDPDPSIIMQKIARKTLIPTILWLFLTFYL